LNVIQQVFDKLHQIETITTIQQATAMR